MPNPRWWIAATVVAALSALGWWSLPPAPPTLHDLPPPASARAEPPPRPTPGASRTADLPQGPAPAEGFRVNAPPGPPVPDKHRLPTRPADPNAKVWPATPTAFVDAVRAAGLDDCPDRPEGARTALRALLVEMDGVGRIADAAMPGTSDAFEACLLDVMEGLHFAPTTLQFSLPYTWDAP